MQILKLLQLLATKLLKIATAMFACLLTLIRNSDGDNLGFIINVNNCRQPYTCA